MTALSTFCKYNTSLATRRCENVTIRTSCYYSASQQVVDRRSCEWVAAAPLSWYDRGGWYDTVRKMMLHGF